MGHLIEDKYYISNIKPFIMLMSFIMARQPVVISKRIYCGGPGS